MSPDTYVPGDAVAAYRQAMRWLYCCQHGFPVRNQTATPGKEWVAFRNNGGLASHAFYGSTPDQAVDRAIFWGASGA